MDVEWCENGITWYILVYIGIKWYKLVYLGITLRKLCDKRGAFMEKTFYGKKKLYLFVQGLFLLFCYRLKIENHSLALRGPRSNQQGESASEFLKNFQAARHCRSPSASWKEKKTHAAQAPRAARHQIWRGSRAYEGHDPLPPFLMRHRTRSTVSNTERRIKVYSG